MREKNKKKKVMSKIVVAIFIVATSMIFTASSVMAVTTSTSLWGDDPSRFENDENYCGTENKPIAHLVGCRCNYDYTFTASKKNLHIVCDQKIPDSPSSQLVCSTNNFNTSGYQVCLVRSNSPCTISPSTDTADSSSCEAGMICKAGKCVLDTGSDIFSGGGLGTEVSDIRDTIRTFINIALGFLGVLCVIFIIYGGVLWLTSAGKSDQVKKGQDTMIWAALGAIIITIAWTITSYVLHIGETVG